MCLYILSLEYRSGWFLYIVSQQYYIKLRQQYSVDQQLIRLETAR